MLAIPRLRRATTEGPAGIVTTVLPGQSASPRWDPSDDWALREWTEDDWTLGARSEGAGRDRRPGDRWALRWAILPPPRITVSRGAAAESGGYAGAALVVTAFGAVAIRAWPQWPEPTRVLACGLLAVALMATGWFLRTPWARPLTGPRRRAVSTLLTGGCVALAGTLTGGLDVLPGSLIGLRVVLAPLVVLGLVGCLFAARSPLGETALLGGLAWAIWLTVPPGPWPWASLAILGVAWATLVARWVSGPWTALVAGSILALVAAVGLAAGPWAWPSRAGLIGLTVLGLLLFVRGGSNGWLALGAGAAAASGVAVAGDVAGPALALCVGGVATMAVSGAALRREGKRVDL